MIELPEGCELIRMTPEFDQSTVPAGLLRRHRVAAGVWGRLVVLDGSLRFGFDDDDREAHIVWVGEAQVIPPQRPHRVVLDGAVRFVVEFHRPPVPLSS